MILLSLYRHKINLNSLKKLKSFLMIFKYKLVSLSYYIKLLITYKTFNFLFLYKFWP